MRLTKLEIYGFKSFAHRTQIVFPQNVTGIVGPNGSGKSNISDAVRWVLGEQSARLLRGNSMADVIFNGTQTKKAMNYCEVTLVFDNADHSLPVAFDEVSITRRVYRSGEGEYLMNGAACRLKDIVDLFRDTGVGKEGYSIVGQGRIDDILSQRSEDRRAVFEEAAGISRFRSRKDDAEARLKRADENLLRVVDVLDELEKRLEPLKKQADVAREYLDLSQRLRALDVRLFLARHDRLSEREKTLRSALEDMRQSLAQNEAALEEAQAGRARLMERQERAQEALGQAHDALLSHTDALHAAREALSAADNDVRNGEETLARLATEGDSLRDRLRLIQATLTQSGGGLEEAQALRDAARDALEKRREAHAAATAAADQVEAELSEHKAQILRRMDSLQDVRTTAARQSAMQQQMLKRRDEIAGQLKREDEREEELAGAVTREAANLRAEEERLRQLRSDADSLERNTKQLLTDILTCQKRLQEDLQSARAMDTRLKTLKELQDGYEGYQHAVKNALNHARRNGLKGVRDVVAMLLTVPKEYETALDMALGAAMQNIVTDTEEDAKALIEYLRANRLGRATFLPLSTVLSRTLTQRERAVLSMDGCVGVASELCAYDPAYRGVMENLLGRTVVARDLDSGIRIMRAGGHAFRLVTLQGDVMHSGGSMTGGSIQQKAQNLLGREREMKELRQALEEVTGRAQEAQRRLEALENQRAGEKDRRESAQYALHQQEIAVARDTERKRAAQAEYDAHRARMREYGQAIAQLDEGLEQLTAELQRLDELSRSGQTDTETLNARTEALAARLDEARRARESAQEALTDAMLTLQNAQHDVDSLQRDRDRLTDDGERCRADLKALADRQSAAQQALEAARTREAQAREAIGRREAGVEEARAHVADCEAARDRVQQELRTAQDGIDMGQQLVNRDNERIHRQELALSRLSSELSQLCQRLWDAHELTYAGAQEALADEPPDAAFDEAAAEAGAKEVRERIRSLGTVNVGAIDEYAQTNERYTQLQAQRNDLEQAKRDLEALIARLLKQMETVFVSQFGTLQGYFAQTFRRLFGGGNGELSLSDPGDPLNCGIEIIVQPPGKRRQLLSLFSGGERALTAIAILFAMLKLKPTPFCILDEIEAALDDANIGYFADYLKEFSRDTQFVVVTHRKGTMERCDTLFGVAMEERGISSMVSVNLTDYH